MVPALLLALVLSTRLDAASEDALEPSSHPAGSREMSQIQEYTRTLSKEWLKDLFHLDLDAIGGSVQRRANPYSRMDLGGVAAGASPLGGANYAVHFRLEQYDDIRRLVSDRRDIPFALRLEVQTSVGAGLPPISTSLYLPMSWKDELRAGASIPLPQLGLPFGASTLDTDRFLSGWKLTSAYTNRLGVSSVETGLGAQWKKNWNVDLDYHIRFGQGIDEYSQWLRVGRAF